MNCQAPFPDDDPFLPRRDARQRRCPTCGAPGRDDFGCDFCRHGARPSGLGGVVFGLLFALLLWATCYGLAELLLFCFGGDS